LEMKITVGQVKERLRTVIDPELNINIVDLGLVYKVKVGTGKAKVFILMTLTTPGCPLAGVIDAMTRKSLEDLPDINIRKDIDIELTFDPPWVPDMMSEEAKAELNL
jgi:metal-sulfur cluster biosynthetic enzyme